MTLRDQQELICARVGSALVVALDSEKLGIALATLHETPINGLRIQPTGDICGWYVWGGGEMSKADDFFSPLHVSHVSDRCAEILPYLALAPGWRFLIAPGYEDIWYDESVLTGAP